MVPDAEVLKVLVEQLAELAALSDVHAKYLGNFVVKINHRQILDGVFKVCGVPTEKLRPISSSIDKLDKVRTRTARSCRLDTNSDEEVGEQQVETDSRFVRTLDRKVGMR